MTDKIEFLTDLSEILKAIAAGKENYIATRQWVHLRACEGLFHAAQFGNAQALTALYSLVSNNDKASFKAWVMRVTTFLNAEGKERSWAKYSDDKGFQVKAGADHPEAVRKDVFTAEDLLASVPFYDTAKKTKQALNKSEAADKAIATSLDDLKTIVGRMEKYNVLATAEVNAALVTLQDFFKKLKEGEETETEEEIGVAPEAAAA